MIVIVEQAEAEVVPSSRLVEVEVGVGGSGFWLGLLFRLGWVRDLESKANLNSSCSCS